MADALLSDADAGLAPIPVTPQPSGGYQDASGNAYTQASPTDPGARRGVLLAPSAPKLMSDADAGLPPSLPPQLGGTDFWAQQLAAAKAANGGVNRDTLRAGPTPFQAMGNTAEDGVGTLMNGLTGGWANKTAAALQTTLENGIGPNWADAYSKHLTNENYRTQDFVANHPTVGPELSGAGMVSQGLIAPELKGASVLGPMLQGAGIGAFNASGQARGNVGDQAMAGLTGAAQGAATGMILHHLTAGTPADPTLGAYARQGVNPMLAVDGPTWMQKLGQLAKGSPLGGPLEAGAEHTSGQLAGRVQDIATGLSGSTAPDAFSAGSALQSGAQASTAAAHASAQKAYQAVDALKSQSRAPLPATTALEGQMRGQFPNIPGYIDKNAPLAADTFNMIRNANGALNPGEIQTLRSDIGLQTRGMPDGPDKARLQMLYGSLSDDLNSGVGSVAHADAIAGGQTPRQASIASDAAQEQLRGADAQYKAMMDNHRAAIAPVFGKDNAPSPPAPEQVFTTLQKYAQNRGGANIQRLQAVRDHVGPDAWNEMGAAQLAGMGQKGDGFSAPQFATNYGKMSMSGRDAMFGPQGAPLRQNVDDVAAIARRQQSAAAFYNHSNSGHVGGLMGAGLLAMEAAQHGAHAIIPLVGGLGGMGLAARMLSSPTLTRAFYGGENAIPGLLPSLGQGSPGLLPALEAMNRRLPGLGVSGLYGASPGSPGQTAP